MQKKYKTILAAGSCILLALFGIIIFNNRSDIDTYNIKDRNNSTVSGTQTFTEYPTENTTVLSTEKPTEKPTENTPVYDPSENNGNNPVEYSYILNTNTKKFHYPDCKSVKKMLDSNKESYHGTREDVIGMGYTPCHNSFFIYCSKHCICFP